MLTLVIVVLVVAVMVAGRPIISEQLAAFIDNLPGYLTKLQSLVADPSRPWLRQDLRRRAVPTPANRSSGLVTQGSGCIAAFLASLWSGGQALFSMLSLLVITPVVAFYLLLDWDRVVATVDGWIPLQHREHGARPGARDRRRRSPASCAGRR